jgi:hypothetical protein
MASNDTETDDSGDSRVRPEYPNSQLDVLRRRALQEFNARLAEHGRGKNWLFDHPRDHLFKAVDELFVARGREEAGDAAGMIEHKANALNHILMGMEVVQADPDYDIPEELQTTPIMSTTETEADDDHYEELCRAMQPGLLLTVNESDPTATPYGEMEVVDVDRDSALVRLKSGDDSYRIHHDGPDGETRIEEVDDEGYGRRSKTVTTIEVVGIA